jgi:hypothetical protein
MELPDEAIPLFSRSEFTHGVAAGERHGAHRRGHRRNAAPTRLHGGVTVVAGATRIASARTGRAFLTLC